VTWSEKFTLSLYQEAEGTSSVLYKWLFVGAIALCLLLGVCVSVLLIKLVLKKRRNTSTYQDALPSTTDGIPHIYELCEDSLHHNMENINNTLGHIDDSLQRNTENTYLTVIDNAGT
jgi:hypothetical protein